MLITPPRRKTGKGSRGRRIDVLPREPSVFPPPSEDAERSALGMPGARGQALVVVELAVAAEHRVEQVAAAAGVVATAVTRGLAGARCKARVAVHLAVLTPHRIEILRA